jgi:hypothetical protein
MKTAIQALTLLSLLVLMTACGSGAPEPSNSNGSTVNTPNLGSAIDHAEAVETQPITIVPVAEPEDDTDIELQEEPADIAVPAPTEPAPKPEPIKNIAAAEDFGPLMDYTKSAVDAYDGVDVESPLSPDATSAFMTSTFFGFAKSTELQTVESSSKQQWLDFMWKDMFLLPEVSLQTTLFFLPNPGQYTCYAGADASGSVKVTLLEEAINEFSDRRTYTLQYDQCAKSPDTEYNGEFIAVFNWDKASLAASHVYLAYNGLRIANATQDTELNGTVKWPNPQACRFNGAKTYYLNAKNSATGKSIFLENFKTAFFSTNENDCTLDDYQPNYFSGRLLNSDFGAVNVSTPAHLQLSLDNPYFYQQPFNTSAGEVIFEAAGASASFSLSRYSKLEPFSEFDQPIKLATLSLNQVGPHESLTYTQHAKLFWHGGFSDLNDSDHDTMIDSWEQLSGLDAHDASDAESDDDNDNRTALWEFNNLGIPNNADEYGVTFDREVTMLVSRESIYQRDIDITIDSQITGTRYKDTDHVVTVTASASGSWNTAGAPCTVVFDNNALECNRTFNLTQPAVITFTPAADGEITFTASAAIPEQDFNPHNNQVSTTLPFDIRVTDYAVNWTDTPNQTKYLIEAETDYLYAEAELLTTNADSWIYITVDNPEHVEITNAQFGIKSKVHTQNYPNNCYLGETIVCQTGLSNSNDIIALRLQVSVPTPGVYTLQLSVPTEEHDPDHSNNTAVLTLETLADTDELQALIDNALPGSTVVLPSGDFAGPLSLSNKQLVLQGSNDSVPTILYSLDKQSHSIADTGSYSLIQSIHFKSAGLAIAFNAGDNLTIADNQFEPLLIDDASIVSPIVDSETPASGLAGQPRDANYRFINNRIMGFGFTPGSSCDGLLPAAGWRNVFVESNTFYDINCTGVFTGNNDGLNGITQTLHILNNTFSDVSTILNFGIDAADEPHHTQVDNNIFDNVNAFFGFRYLSTYLNTQSSMTSNANLIHKHTRYHFMSNNMLAQPNHRFVINDIAGDPLFVDRQNADFRILPESRAVDAGINVTTGDMGISYDNEALYTDGLGNGEIKPDIGASEFMP